MVIIIITIIMNYITFTITLIIIVLLIIITIIITITSNNTAITFISLLLFSLLFYISPISSQDNGFCHFLILCHCRAGSRCRESLLPSFIIYWTVTDSIW